MKTIAIGLDPGELLKPHNRDYDVKKVENFHEYIKKNNIETFKSNIDATKFICENYKNLNTLKIIGSYVEACISYSIGIALKLDINVICPEDLIFYHKKTEQIEKLVKSWRTLHEKDLVLLIKKGEANKELNFDYNFTNNIHKFISK